MKFEDVLTMETRVVESPHDAVEYEVQAEEGLWVTPEDCVSGGQWQEGI